MSVTAKQIAHELAHGAALFAITGDYYKGIVLCADGGEVWMEFETLPGVFAALARTGPHMFIGVVSAGLIFDLWAHHQLDIQRLPYSDLLKAIRLHCPMGSDDDNCIMPSDTALLAYSLKFASLPQIKTGLEIGRTYALLLSEHFLLHPTLFAGLAAALEIEGELAVEPADLAHSLNNPGQRLRVQRVQRVPRAASQNA